MTLGQGALLKQYVDVRLNDEIADALKHLLDNVLPGARDYECAEEELSAAFARNPAPVSWIAESQYARRCAASLSL